MSGATFLNSIRESATIFWNERNARERNILLAGGAIVVAFLLYSILFGPAINGRAQLNKDLPLLRQQAAELQALSKQAADLNRAGATEAPPISHDSIATSLTARGMKPQNLSVNDGLVRLQINPVSFAGLLEWMNEQQKTTRLIVVDANFVALPQNDTVNATLTLKQQRSEGG